MHRRQGLLTALVLLATCLQAQNLRSIALDTSAGLRIVAVGEGAVAPAGLPAALPLFTLELNDTVVSSASGRAVRSGDSIVWTMPQGIDGWVKIGRDSAPGWSASVTFRNASSRTQRIAGVVPLGESPDHVFIKAWGPSDQVHRLSRSHLFRPGRAPIGVILPDNAWEMGYGDAAAGGGTWLCAIARRTGSEKAEERRFRTILEPKGTVTYVFHLDTHTGTWQDGLRLMFQRRWLYDLPAFDETLYERDDLKWIRRSYLLLLQFAWDSEYYNSETHSSRFDTFIHKYDHLVGGFEAFMLWPTWPRLGLDQRNQWDMYRDLPGGIAELRRQSAVAHRANMRYFIAYNPWDESTRNEDHVKGMEEMLRAIDADGVVLDTWGESSRMFQAAADRVKPGIILYSEGMAVPKDMPGIVAGRVHDAIFLPPPLNLNKVIKPDIAIFRVAQLAEGRIHRESAVAFFNGYGTEMNIMRPGRPDWIEEEFAYLGRTTKILRENSDAFLSKTWDPLIPTLGDSIWVNAWPAASKTLYTVYSLRPDGWNGTLFDVPAPANAHYVSLWNHEELQPESAGGRMKIRATVDGFSRSWLDTRREGNVDCIAQFPNLLDATLIMDSLRVRAATGSRIVVWAGPPSYSTRSTECPVGERTIALIDHLGTHEEKYVVQLFDGTNLLDERVVNLPLATPRLISKTVRTAAVRLAPKGMVEVPAAMYTFRPSRGFLSPNEVIPYPGDSTTRIIPMRRFFIDETPVTNEAYLAFIRSAKYRPADTVNYLRHWVNGHPRKNEEHHPVVWVSLDDARAFARWAAKRLPTEVEWQYAAQGTDGRKYPWGNMFDSTKCNWSVGVTTPVAAFPSGRSPFGVLDLIGNVWQLTNDVYNNGTFIFGMLRGGSYFRPTSSWWYIPGGPQPADNPQILLMVSPGFDRNATVGFRCVKDAVQ